MTPLRSRPALVGALLLGAAAALAYAPAIAQTPDAALAAAVAAPTRTAANMARDQYRHPAETLAFFGVRPDQTLVEYVPGGGWYTEILGPLLREKGHYIALVPDNMRMKEGTAKLLAAHKAILGANAELATVDPSTGASTLAPDSADVILTFRNVHNLIMNGDDAAPHVFGAFYKALKPGGVLGVVDHRLPENRDSALEKKSGYLKRSTIVKLATDAGFRLVGESEINANPKDKANYPGGVWTLPPVLARGEENRAAYLAIGESDRMTLKFVKPR